MCYNCPTKVCGTTHLGSCFALARLAHWTFLGFWTSAGALPSSLALDRLRCLFFRAVQVQTTTCLLFFSI